MISSAMQGQATRRDVIKGSLKAGVYAAPVVLSAAVPIVALAVSGPGGQVLNVAPASGPLGTVFSFAGSRFTPNATYDVVRVAAPAGTPTTGVIVTVTASSLGTFSFSVSVSPLLSAGTYVVGIAPTGTMNILVQLAFTVTAGALPATPTLSVAPASGPVGTAFAFQASGLTSGTSYTVGTTSAPAGVATGTIGTVTAPASGQAIFSLIGGTAGTYVVAITVTGSATVLTQVSVTVTGAGSRAVGQSTGVTFVAPDRAGAFGS